MPYKIINNTTSDVVINTYIGCVGDTPYIIKAFQILLCDVTDNDTLHIGDVCVDHDYSGQNWGVYQQIVSHTIIDLLEKGLTIEGEVSASERQAIEDKKKKEEAERLYEIERKKGLEKIIIRKKEILERGITITTEQVEEFIQNLTVEVKEIHFEGEEHSQFKYELIIYADLDGGKFDPCLKSKSIYGNGREDRRELSQYLEFAVSSSALVSWARNPKKLIKFFADSGITVLD
ncbi:hypothetical protein EBB07_29270 [Paenibacillaceae bacterium]|nr:hypothetical protein EBB07_29270 [Paenibacillaceae bacterium]